jgi:hypothetical protein
MENIQKAVGTKGPTTDIESRVKLASWQPKSDNLTSL